MHKKTSKYFARQLIAWWKWLIPLDLDIVACVISIKTL